MQLIAGTSGSPFPRFLLMQGAYSTYFENLFLALRMARPDYKAQAEYSLRAVQEASLQFGVFQFDPEDHTMFRNQIVGNELQRCLRMVHEQSSELRSSADAVSAPSYKLQQNWLSVIENRARLLDSSLKSTDVAM